MVNSMPLNKPQVLVVIPARYGSTRFPGKPLALIDGKPMIQHVVERASRAQYVNRVIVATDDSRIEEAVLAFGGEVKMTADTHESGTDRVWEVAQAFPEYELIFNVQGDEPFLDPSSLDRAIIAIMEQSQCAWVTLATPIQSEAERLDPNIVKVVLGTQGQALYFSRSPIPFVREPQDTPTIYRHLGLYLFRRDALAQFIQWPPSILERAERLEQLRALENGIGISVIIVEKAPIGIDTPADLERLHSGIHP